MQAVRCDRGGAWEAGTICCGEQCRSGDAFDGEPRQHFEQMSFDCGGKVAEAVSGFVGEAERGLFCGFDPGEQQGGVAELLAGFGGVGVQECQQFAAMVG